MSILWLRFKVWLLQWEIGRARAYRAGLERTIANELQRAHRFVRDSELAAKRAEAVLDAALFEQRANEVRDEARRSGQTT